VTFSRVACGTPSAATAKHSVHWPRSAVHHSWDRQLSRRIQFLKPFLPCFIPLNSFCPSYMIHHVAHTNE
jgi:hypothetical protein